MDYHGKEVVVLGLAREGASLTRFLAAHGAKVTVTDSAPATRLGGRISEVSAVADIVVGSDRPALVDTADVLFVSPGVPESNAVYQAAVKRGMRIESMTTLFFDLCPTPIVGITGSSGKTTTTSLLGHIMRAAGIDAVIGGNIGDPMLDLLPRIHSDSAVVLELSSFQLQILRRSPHIAVITNISPNHLDRHGDMAVYVSAKRHIIQHQTEADIAVLNGADCSSADMAAHTAASVRWFGGDHNSGAAEECGVVVLRGNRTREPVLPVGHIPLLGRHNLENVLAACTVSECLGITPAVMAQAIMEYRPPAHRLQLVGESSGVWFIDDSIATTPERSMVAMQAIDGPLIVIAGGRDKALPWDRWANMVGDRARAVILIGEAADMIEDLVRAAIEHGSECLQPEGILRADTLETAVRRAQTQAMAGDTVLLSPGCSSYDMFTDYHERGAAFARAVETLDAT